jgi:hypothetical protein
MAARARRRRGGLLVLIGFLTIIAVTFGAGVYAGRIWMARSVVTVARITEPEPARRPVGRGAKPAEPPAPQLTFYRELTAPLTAPPPPPKPAEEEALPVLDLVRSVAVDRAKDPRVLGGALLFALVLGFLLGRRRG